MPQAATPPAQDAPAKALRVRFDRFELDEKNASLTCEGKPIALGPTPFAVLCALVRQQGLLVTKNGLLDEVWGHRFVTESVLKTVIGKVRTALQDDARKPRFIETVSRRGYRFIAPTVAAAGEGWTQESQATAADGDAFVGRAEALGQLGAAWNRAIQGKRAIVWLAGDPGIGKTTLIERFVSTLAGVACVRGQCVEQYGSGEPYLPVLEALGELCRRDSAAVPILRTVAPTWLVQLPWLTTAEERDVLRRELAGLGADRMLREMAEFIERYTERTPLLLVTEDLHWSDRSTMQLLDCIARRRASARFMWLASFRLSEVIALDHPLNPLRRELRLHGLCEEIVLDPFSESEVAQYVALRSPSLAADEAFVRALHERTDGLPLFVGHILDDSSAHAQGASGQEAAQVAALAVPENLAAIVEHYVVKLPEDERTLLAAASVCGTDFRVDTLADVLEIEPSTVGQACEELTRKRLLVAETAAQKTAAPPRRIYSFRHSLFRQVLYERTPAVLLARLHHRAALALEKERAAGITIAATELAMHFERGGEAISAMRYYAEAAEAALLHFSPGESLRLAEHGLSLRSSASATPERDAAELALATLAGVSSGHLLGLSSVQAKGWLERAYQLLAHAPGHRMRALLLHMLGMGLSVRGEYAAALSVAERTEKLATETSDPILMRAACLIQGDVRMLQGRPRIGCEWLERGAAIESAPSPAAAPEDGLVADPHISILALLGLQLLHLGRVATARERLQEARDRARESAQPIAEMIAIWLETLAEVRLADVDRVDALASQMEALVEKFALAQGRNACGWFRGWVLAKTGRPREGFALIRDAYEENVGLGMRSGGAEVVGYAAEALLLAGDLDGAQAQLDEALEIAQTLGERIYLPQLLTIDASIARARGDSAQADASLRKAIAEAREQQARWLELEPLAQLCASSTAKRGDREALAALIAAMPEASATRAVSTARALLARSTSRVE